MSLFDLAEAPSRFELLRPPEELVECDGAFVVFGVGTDEHACNVQRPRFHGGPAGIAAAVERVREVVRSRGKHRATWHLMAASHPPATLDALRALGMKPAQPPVASVRLLSRAPLVRASGVNVTRVETIPELRVHVAITHAAFDMLDRLPAELARIDAGGAPALADRSFIRYVARVDGEPAGAGCATFTAAGVMLHSGSTLPRFRGRGVYTALVAHRWEEAVAHGTPHLITRAGPMSEPILEKLGFTELGKIHFLVDEVVPSHVA